MVGTAVVGSLVASLLGVLPIAADPPTPPPTGRVVIDVVTVNGSGCPAGSASVAVAPDNTAFAVTYSIFGPLPSPPTDSRKACALNLTVHPPGGYTYAIQEVTYDGSAVLGPGAVGRHRAVFGFVGAPPSPTPPPTTTHLVDGPYADDWQATDTIDAASLIFAPCDRLRSLATTNAVDVTPVKSNFMTLDSATYRLAWRQCPTT